MKKLAEDATLSILPHYYTTGHTDKEFSGTSMDFYVDSGIPYSYTIELPDFGQFGFLIPPSMIPTVRCIIF